MESVRSNIEVSLQIPPGAGVEIPVEPATDAIDGGVLLPVPYIEQRPAANLCWAACCEMIFRANRITNTKMCDIVGIVSLPPRNCCTGDAGHPVASECDQSVDPLTAYNILQQTLRFTWQCDPPTGARMDWQSLTNAINVRHRPIEAQYNWSGGSETDTQAHVVLVIGSRADGFVYVNDPWLGRGWVAYGDVCSAYGLGSWADSYPGVGDPLVPLT